MAVQPRDEQEIILTYDRERDKWFYYGGCSTSQPQMAAVCYAYTGND